MVILFTRTLERTSYVTVRSYTPPSQRMTEGLEILYPKKKTRGRRGVVSANASSIRPGVDEVKYGNKLIKTMLSVSSSSILTSDDEVEHGDKPREAVLSVRSSSI